MMKKLLHISLGTHQKAMRNAFDKHFNTLHYDWTAKQNDTNSINADILQLAESFNPDIVFMQLQTPGIIHIETAKKLAEKSIVINWTGDVRAPIPNWYIELGKHIDVTMFTNNNDVATLNNMGINAQFLPIGFDPEINTPNGEKKPSPEIIFCGSNYSQAQPFPLSYEREEMVRFLDRNYKPNVGIYGAGWQEIIPYAQFIDINNEAIAYRSGKIGINLSHFNYDRYYSDRLLKMMACGILVLSHNYHGIEKDFTIGKHLDVFNNLHELKQKIDYYLSNPKKANKISTEGCNYVHQNYTWDSVLLQLKKIIGTN